MPKYTIAVMPASIHDCGRSINPDRPNVLSLGVEQVVVIHGDSKAELDRHPVFQKGKQFRSITCCMCRHDVLPTYLAVMQRISPFAIDITMMKPYSITGLEAFKGWVLVGLVEVVLGIKYNLN